MCFAFSLTIVILFVLGYILTDLHSPRYHHTTNGARPNVW